MRTLAESGRAFITIVPDVSPAPDRATVDVFVVPLTIDEGIRNELRKLLSPDEIARADRFVDAQVGSRFTAARASLRLLLGRRLRCRPESIAFTYGAKGKPALAQGGLTFNLSHSGDLAVIAVAESRAVGIDIERYREDLDHLKLARRFFSEAERQDIDALPPEKRQDAFYACWTRKEAYMKAVGDGFSIPLRAFRVSVHPDEPAALLDVASDPRETARWILQDVEVPVGYRACVAVEGALRALRRFSVAWV